MALRNFLGTRKGSTPQQPDDNKHAGVTSHKTERWLVVRKPARRLRAIGQPVWKHPVTRRAVRVAKVIGRPILALLFFGAAVSVTSYSRTPSVAVGALADSTVQIDE